MRPGYSQSTVNPPDDEPSRQFDQSDPVEHVDEMEPINIESRSQHKQLNEAQMEEDWSIVCESGSEDNDLNMREVIDIFQPASQFEACEGAGGEEEGGESEVEVEGEEVDDQGWFPFGGLVVSTKSGKAGRAWLKGSPEADTGACTAATHLNPPDRLHAQHPVTHAI